MGRLVILALVSTWKVRLASLADILLYYTIKSLSGQPELGGVDLCNPVVCGGSIGHQQPRAPGRGPGAGHLAAPGQHSLTGLDVAARRLGKLAAA